jgi:hypothetical protein
MLAPGSPAMKTNRQVSSETTENELGFRVLVNFSNIITKRLQLFTAKLNSYLNGTFRITLAFIDMFE